MYRYMCFAWDPANAIEVERARDLVRKLQHLRPAMTPALRRPGLAVFASSDSPGSFAVYKGADENVLVLGKLFHREMDDESPPAEAELHPVAARAIYGSRGRALIERYWGGYVAFIHDEAERSTFVVRDPTADVPCCMTRVGDMSIVFSCVEDCLALGLRFSINWQHVTAWLVRPYIQVRQTGLREVSVIAPGECLELHAGIERQREYYWNIADIAADDPIEDVETAAALARRTIRGCVGALVSGHGEIMHRLSGGLDSSTILASLMLAPSRPDVTCVHHFDLSSGADERHFARLAVEGASARAGRDCRLIECERVPSDLRLDRSDAFPRTAFPSHYAGYLSERHIGPEATSNGRAIHFTGHAGDAIFGRLDHEYAAIDYVWRHGLGPQLPRIAYEAAQGGRTVYGVLGCAIHKGLLKRDRALNTFKKATMVNRDIAASARADIRNVTPAWIQATSDASRRRLSPEKLQHIELMSLPWKLLDPYERVGEWEWFAPLTAQPVVELFARMPLYTLMADAEERTIARRAFAQDLPEKLLARRTKSYLNNFMFSVIRQHESFLRETYCDGILVKEGILDRTLVEKALKILHTDADPLIRDLIGPQLNMEIWLRNWSRNAQGDTRAIAA